MQSKENVNIEKLVEFKVNIEEAQRSRDGGAIISALNNEQVNKIKALGVAVELIPNNDSRPDTFPTRYSSLQMEC